MGDVGVVEIGADDGVDLEGYDGNREWNGGGGGDEDGDAGREDKRVDSYGNSERKALQVLIAGLDEVVRVLRGAKGEEVYMMYE